MHECVCACMYNIIHIKEPRKQARNHKLDILHLVLNILLFYIILV